MITSVEFKKHISKTLTSELKKLGFKGSGFNFLIDTEYYVFTIGIQASRYGGECCAEFGFQPKSVETNGFENIDFKKLKYYNCEFRTRIRASNKSVTWWKYSDNENENIKVAYHITDIIKNRYLEIIKIISANPNYLEVIDVADLDNMYMKVNPKLLGMELLTSDIRLAWVLAKNFEKTNLTKTKEFAKYGLSKLEDSSNFFAKKYFENILNDSVNDGFTSG